MLEERLRVTVNARDAREVVCVGDIDPARIGGGDAGGFRDEHGLVSIVGEALHVAAIVEAHGVARGHDMIERVSERDAGDDVGREIHAQVDDRLVPHTEGAELSETNTSRPSVATALTQPGSSHARKRTGASPETHNGRGGGAVSSERAPHAIEHAVTQTSASPRVPMKCMTEYAQARASVQRAWQDVCCAVKILVAWMLVGVGCASRTQELHVVDDDVDVHVHAERDDAGGVRVRIHTDARPMIGAHVRMKVVWERADGGEAIHSIDTCSEGMIDASAPQYAPYRLETITKETVDHDIYVGRGR